MPKYNFLEGKKRILDILNEDEPIEKVEALPQDINRKNAYNIFVTAVCVNIRKASVLFKHKDKIMVAKIVRAFTSEVMEILQEDDDNEDLLREIGIRDDRVYAIYSTPGKHNIQSIINKTICINTYVDMLNKMLEQHGITEQLKAGIGVATAQELVVKAGKQGTGLNHAVWIGDAVITALKYSAVGAKDGIFPIAISDKTYLNLSLNQKDAFTFIHTTKEGYLYHSNSINGPMNKWIKAGLPS